MNFQKKPETTSSESSGSSAEKWGGPERRVTSGSKSAGFWDGLTRFFVTLLPFALGAGLIAVRLPPWFDEMAKLWGPGFIILGIIVLGFIRYVPPGAVRDMIKSQQQQVEAMRALVRSIENIEKQLEYLLKNGGPLSEMEKKLDHIDWRLGFALQGVRPPPMKGDA